MSSSYNIKFISTRHSSYHIMPQSLIFGNGIRSKIIDKLINSVEQKNIKKCPEDFLIALNNLSMFLSISGFAPDSQFKEWRKEAIGYNIVDEPNYREVCTNRLPEVKNKLTDLIQQVKADIVKEAEKAQDNQN